MRRFKTIAPTTLHGGIVELTRSQALPRERSLRHLEGDLYEVRGMIQFKVGEIIGLRGEVNKRLLQSIDPLEEEKQETAKPQELKSNGRKKRFQ